jgi:hypothetical protein
MGHPKFPKGLDFAGGAIVTLVLEDFQQLTGRFIGSFEDRQQYCGPTPEFYKPDYNKGKYDDKCKCGDEHKHDDKCCKPPKVDIEVEVEDDREFVVLQLTEPAGVVTLSSAAPLISGLVTVGVTLGITSTTFAEGTFVAVNVDQIVYAATGGVTTTFAFPLDLSILLP